MSAPCRGGWHNLREIMRVHQGHDIDEVVRWCQNCGAIVIDGEHDGRVYNGKVMPMRFPANKNEANNG